MKNNTEDLKTTGIRSTLQFLNFIETKILANRLFYLDRLDVKEIKGFNAFMIRFLSD